MKKAAEKGDDDAILKIGALYEEGGYGVQQNYIEAEKWYQKSKNGYFYLTPLRKKWENNFYRQIYF